MSESDGNPVELTYSMGAAARLTGLSPELLRAWERRHGAVEPLRTPGGTRRYRASDLERLRLVKAAVEAGHRIGRIASLSADELRRCVPTPADPLAAAIEEILAAVDRLDSVEAQRALSLGMASLGPVRFARELALPLVIEIGERWATGRMGIASEHLATSVLRSMLGAALQPTSATLAGPRILFATPSGEPHELGLQMAALTAMGAGANPLYLGTGVPVPDMIDAAEKGRVDAVALSLVTIEPKLAAQQMAVLSEALPAETRLWIGGGGAALIDTAGRVEVVDDLTLLEAMVLSVRHAKAVEVL